MRIPLKPTILVLATVLAVAMVAPSEAATVRRLQLEEIRDGASSIFWGQVVDQSTRLAEGRIVWTDYRISVSEYLRGPNPGALTTVSYAGGTKGDVSIGIHGMPRLEIGRTYLFFINPDRQDGRRPINATIGWGQGLYRIERVEIDGAKRDLLVSWDGEPLEMSDDGRILRGPGVDVRNGSVVDLAARRQADISRAADPTFTTPDGKPVPQHWGPRPERSVRQRNFATLDDLRAFVDGRIEAEGRTR